MKVDLYTKLILTVIALCLTVIVFRDTTIIPEARAASDDVKKVQIVGVSLFGYGTQALPVKIEK